MITMDKKYKYRNGEEARILCVDAPAGDAPIISMGPDGYIYRHSTDGIFNKKGGFDDYNLIEVKPTKTMWLNIYRDTGYDTKEEAERLRYADCDACIMITYTEGEGL